MQTVKDNEGRPWMIQISLAAVGRIAELVKVDREVAVSRPDGSVGKATESVPFQVDHPGMFGETLGTLRSNFLALGETAYAVCKPQADEKKITREQFLDGLAGDSLEEIRKAILDELLAFFPPSVRGTLRILRAKFEEVSEALLETAEQQLASVDPKSAATSLSPMAATAAAARKARAQRKRAGGSCE